MDDLFIVKEFDPEKIKKGKKFDESEFNAYRDYLLSVTEGNAIKLPIHYMYDRMRFIGQREQPEILRKLGYNPNPKGKEEVSPKRSNGPSRVYKNWAQD